MGGWFCAGCAQEGQGKAGGVWSGPSRQAACSCYQCLLAGAQQREAHAFRASTRRCVHMHRPQGPALKLACRCSCLLAPKPASCLDVDQHGQHKGGCLAGASLCNEIK